MAAAAAAALAISRSDEQGKAMHAHLGLFSLIPVTDGMDEIKEEKRT